MKTKIYILILSVLFSTNLLGQSFDFSGKWISFENNLFYEFDVDGINVSVKHLGHSISFLAMYKLRDNSILEFKREDAYNFKFDFKVISNNEIEIVDQHTKELQTLHKN